MVAEPVKKGEELFTHYVPWQMDGMDGVVCCGWLELMMIFFLNFEL